MHTTGVVRRGRTEGDVVGISEALLVLLARGPRHGYQLKQEWERATGDAWQLNIGQVYTTLQRLERDGLVVLDHETDDRKVYALTDEGGRRAESWLVRTSPGPGDGRDETAMRVLLAAATGVGDLDRIIEDQRADLTAQLQLHTRTKAATPPEELAELLQLDRRILRCRADLDWLELAEERTSARVGGTT